MIKTDVLKYSDSTGLLTLKKIKKYSLEEIINQQDIRIFISWYKEELALDISRSEIKKATCDAGKYEINTMPRSDNETYEIEEDRLFDAWSFPHPSVVIQADQFTKHEKEFRRSLLNDCTRRLWTAFSVTTETGKSYDLHGLIWYEDKAKPFYRLDLMIPKNRLALCTKPMHSRKIK